MTFFTEEDSLQLRPIANLVREAGGDVPDWMLHLRWAGGRGRMGSRRAYLAQVRRASCGAH